LIKPIAVNGTNNANHALWGLADNLSMYTSCQNGFTRIAENNAKAVMQAIAILISEEYRPRFRPNDTMLDLYFIETHNQAGR
jgi:hypothetical protein